MSRPRTRCFCLMLGLSLLVHGGFFLYRSPLPHLAEPQTAPLSLRLAVMPQHPAQAETPQPGSPPIPTPQEKRPPQPVTRQETVSPPKRHPPPPKKEKRKRPSQETGPSPKLHQVQPAQSPPPLLASSPPGTAQSSGKASETAGPRRTSFDAVDGPKFLQPPAPRYPRLARRKGIEARVLMELTIDAEGRLLNASVKQSGGTGFDEAALEAVRKASFRPATHNGQPSACTVLLPIHFTLRNAS